ncbi:centromere-binding protein CNN1 KNAG_0D02930 [Huiozyma naganishii CBS 8797]|uniref:Uncharacterized protein n=1 Tax=Huiozyma naganishii (strain ATCC MYA-139 / BCRC 22969 / CBS 8797 / KCTC 17520 / NBRC 10181 / NCYC 3082 / Yp74L-3) TaxID=1071383 RepID=J7RY47_HUIN7|nr:hypothetical protein KNAG_0D02930 [Kazachstania naganishii CBS 8797]CCK70042.1 hypothetical protein KNAG_0D02930 [Kazachstania naganishii CBS 8797]
MNTPSKTRLLTADASEVITPFKERALEEQRLRETLLLSLTPGLQRRVGYQDSLRPLQENPRDTRLFLRDLSLALEARDRRQNLASKLGDALKDTDDEDDQEQDQLREIVQFSPPGSPRTSARSDQQTEEGDVESRMDEAVEPEVRTTESPKRLSQLIFSQLKGLERATKVRKIEPINIADVDPGSRNTQTNFGPQTPLHYSSQIGHDPVTDDNPASVGPNATTPSPETQIRHDDASLHYDDAAYEIPESVTPAFKHSPAWNGRVSVTPDSRKPMRGSHDVPNWDGVIAYLSRYTTVPRDVSIRDVYELCCQYMTLEQMNKLDREWFPMK